MTTKTKKTAQRTTKRVTRSELITLERKILRGDAKGALKAMEGRAEAFATTMSTEAKKVNVKKLSDDELSRMLFEAGAGLKLTLSVQAKEIRPTMKLLSEILIRGGQRLHAHAKHEGKEC